MKAIQRSFVVKRHGRQRAGQEFTLFSREIMGHESKENFVLNALWFSLTVDSFCWNWNRGCQVWARKISSDGTRSIHTPWELRLLCSQGRTAAGALLDPVPPILRHWSPDGIYRHIVLRSRRSLPHSHHRAPYQLFCQVSVQRLDFLLQDMGRTAGALDAAARCEFPKFQH